MKFFLAKSTALVFSTECAWLAYVENTEAVNLAKKIHGLIDRRQVNRNWCERA